MQIYPSLMGANQLALASIIDTLEPWCAGFHLDTMDGHAVPNITGGPSWTNAIAHYAQQPVWVHLMITDPLNWINKLKLKPQSMVDFQFEEAYDHHNILGIIKKMGYQAGISIAPHTPLDAVYTLIYHCDYITVMGVEPGFSGQQYMPEVTQKIEALSQLIKAQQLSCAIAVDGGVTATLLPILDAHRVTHVAMASALFNTPDPVAMLKKYAP